MPGPRLDTPLTRVLEQRGIRFGWLAKQLGVKPWTFSRIEGRGQGAPADYYERAAAILGVPVEVVTPERELEGVA